MTSKLLKCFQISVPYASDFNQRSVGVTSEAETETTGELTKAGLTLCDFFKSLLGLCLSDCTNMMIMSHYGISVVINVRLYDSQDELKMGARKKTCPDTSSDCELHYTRDRNVGYHEKYMNGGNTGVFKKNSVCSSTHPHENSGATSV